MSSPDHALVPDATRNPTLEWVLGIGLGLSIAFGSIQFWMLGVGTETDSGSLLTRASGRLIVLVTLAVALLFMGRRRLALASVPLLPLWGFAVASSVTAVAATDLVQELDRTVWFGSFLVLCAATAIVVGWDRYVTILSLIGITILGVGIIGHLTELTPAYTSTYFDGTVLPIPRARGLLAASNGFGRAGSMLVLLGATSLVRRPSRFAVAVGAAATIVGVVSVVLSQSRIPTAAMLLCLLVLLVRSRPRLRPMLVPVFLLGVFVLQRVLSTGSLGVGARSNLANEADTLLGRTPVWAEAVRVWQTRPFTGVGTETLQAHFTGWFERGLSSWDPANAHNVVLQALTAHGIMAALCLVAMFIVGLRVLVRDGRTGTVEIFLLFLIQGMTEAIFLGNPDFAVAALVGALAVGVRGRLDATAPEAAVTDSVPAVST